MDLERAKAIYRRAIDSGARNSEGEGWWSEVLDEVRAVVAAPDVGTAAALIGWWHHDWSVVGDTPVAAAKRLRAA